LWITNKKSELMLMRHARAYNSSCSQIISVYLHPFRCNSLFRSENGKKKNHKKTPIFKVQGHSMSSMLILLKSTSSVLVMINNTSVPICNRFHDRQDNSGKITTFWRGTLVWHPRAQASLNVLCPDFKVKATVNYENFMCRLSWSMSSRFGEIHFWNVCRSLKSRKIHQNSLFWKFKVI